MKHKEGKFLTHDTDYITITAVFMIITTTAAENFAKTVTKTEINILTTEITRVSRTCARIQQALSTLLTGVVCWIIIIFVVHSLFRSIDHIGY